MSPARSAAERYIASVNAVDLDELSSLFAHDAVVMHPLGTVTGQATIREFYGTNILVHRPMIEASEWVEEGSHCVFELQASAQGRTSHAIDHLTVDEQGKIVRMVIAYR